MKNLIQQIKYNRGYNQFNDILDKIVISKYNRIDEYIFNGILFMRVNLNNPHTNIFIITYLILSSIITWVIKK